MDNCTPLEEFLSAMKASSRDKARELALSVDNEQSVRLVPVGSWILEDDHLITMMAEWRFAARQNYFVQFPFSPESMRRYLETVSVAEPATLLFVIERDYSDVIGHVGLRRVSEIGGEIDSVMRKPAEPPGTMRPSLSALLKWSFEKLGVPKLSLRVLSTNGKAIDLYRKVGFRVTREMALRQRWIADTLFLDEVGGLSKTNVAELSIHMEVDSSISKPFASEDLH